MIMNSYDSIVHGIITLHKFDRFCLKRIDKGKMVDTVYVDFSKAFNKVLYSKLVR